MSNNRVMIKEESLKIYDAIDGEFAVVKNPEYIYFPYEIYPLAPRRTEPESKIVGIAMDMDGTTTTTEEICIHSLEHSIRKSSGFMSKEDWIGLDKIKDYPNIIGNSTTKHVEYLAKTYSSILKNNEIAKSHLSAALWTLFFGKDATRILEVKTNLKNFGVEEAINFIDFNRHKLQNKEEYDKINNELIQKYALTYNIDAFDKKVAAIIDIYYQRYHEILSSLEKGEEKKFAKDVFGSEDHKKNFIEPMPGVEVFLPLIKGYLGKDVEMLSEQLIEDAKKKGWNENFNIKDVKVKLKELGEYFENSPLKISIVTSSIFYEAKIVMTELFKVLRKKYERLPISLQKKELLLAKFESYQNVYDSFVTASDSSEIRLKPHRDLYSIALQRMGIQKRDYANVIGLEDSESGTIALRAAGIGLAIALPFAQTSNHNFQAASLVAKYGLPEIILKYNLFVKK